MLSSILLNEIEIKDLKHKDSLKLLNQKVMENKEAILKKDIIIDNLHKIIELKKKEELSSPQSLKMLQLSKEVLSLEAEVFNFLIKSLNWDFFVYRIMNLECFWIN